jgi:hypothetical protein
MTAPLGNPHLIAPTIAPAVSSTGMADGGSGYAHTSNSGPPRATPEANLRDHAIRVRNWCWASCLRRTCDGDDKASSSNQPDHIVSSLFTVACRPSAIEPANPLAKSLATGVNSGRSPRTLLLWSLTEGFVRPRPWSDSGGVLVCRPAI